MSEVNERIATICGGHEEPDSGGMWWMPNDILKRLVLLDSVPQFTTSMDAIQRWVIPELVRNGCDVSLVYEAGGEWCVTIERWSNLHTCEYSICFNGGNLPDVLANAFLQIHSPRPEV